MGTDGYQGSSFNQTCMMILTSDTVIDKGNGLLTVSSDQGHGETVVRPYSIRS